MTVNLKKIVASGASLKFDNSGKPTTDDFKAITAVLLTAIASSDDTINAPERETLFKLLQNQFDLDDEQASHLSDLGEYFVNNKKSLDGFAKQIVGSFSEAQRTSIIAMLIGVIRADGNVSYLEAAKLADITKLLGLKKQDVEKAMKQVRA